MRLLFRVDSTTDEEAEGFAVHNRAGVPRVSSRQKSRKQRKDAQEQRTIVAQRALREQKRHVKNPPT